MTDHASTSPTSSTVDHQSNTVNVSPKTSQRAAWLIWLAGVAIACAVGFILKTRIVRIVTYQLPMIDVPSAWIAFIGLAVFAVCLAGMLLARIDSLGAPASDRPLSQRSSIVRAAWPLLLPALVSIAWLLGQEPTFAEMCCAFVGFGWSIARMGQHVTTVPGLGLIDRLAPILLILAIIFATVWHTTQQHLFWKHFLLGYADFGLFTTELEHCLPWKNVGDLRFATTRMGFHCVPMFYLLTPFYMACRSPVFLMAIGPLALNIAAIAFYQLAHSRTGSRTIGLVVALAWLLLPSITRLPYSNTYGFQSIYLAVPWLAFCFSFGMQNRWRASHICLVGALLCEETVCGVALGWGVYLWLFGGRRRDGVTIMIGSVVYLLICTKIVIPYFDVGGEYTRLRLFGDAGPIELLQRLTRERVGLFALALTAPLMPAIWRSWRMLIVVAPTFVLVTLMHQYDYLNIKYWHQSSMLPLLFTACVVGLSKKSTPTTSRSSTPIRSTHMRAFGPSLGLLVTVLLFHQWMGSSPIAQSHRIYANDARLGQPDPRMAAIEFVHDRFDTTSTIIIATERMAAHFIDYRMIYPVSQIRLSDTMDTPHVLLFDRADGWDKIVMEHQIGNFLSEAKDANYRLINEIGPILVLANEQALDSQR